MPVLEPTALHAPNQPSNQPHPSRIQRTQPTLHLPRNPRSAPIPQAQPIPLPPTLRAGPVLPILSPDPDFRARLEQALTEASEQSASSRSEGTKGYQAYRPSPAHQQQQGGRVAYTPYRPAITDKPLPPLPPLEEEGTADDALPSVLRHARPLRRMPDGAAAQQEGGKGREPQRTHVQPKHQAHSHPAQAAEAHGDAETAGHPPPPLPQHPPADGNPLARNSPWGDGLPVYITPKDLRRDLVSVRLVREQTMEFSGMGRVAKWGGWVSNKVGRGRGV